VPKSTRQGTCRGVVRKEVRSCDGGCTHLEEGLRPGEEGGGAGQRKYEETVLGAPLRPHPSLATGQLVAEVRDGWSVPWGKKEGQLAARGKCL
jgi:hypothetical protein